MGNARKKISQVVKLHRQWLRDAGPEVLAYTGERVSKNLTEGSLSALRTMKSSLGSFALYYGTKGIVGIVDGQPNAWDDIYLASAFHLNELRLRFALWTRLGDEPSFTLDTSRIACALCFSLGNGLLEWAEFLRDVLSQASWNRQMVMEEYWSERMFEPFVLWLAQLDSAHSPLEYDARTSWGPYSAVIAEWNSPAQFSEALAGACDYHCENLTDDRDDDWKREFDEPPFDLIPWEILAIRTVRKRVGLPTPLPEHPLLASISTFAPRNELPVDERLDAIEHLRLALCMTVRT